MKVTHTHKPRNISVLIIDDQASRLLERDNGCFNHLDKTIISSWADSQRLIQVEGSLERVDLLLIDISFDKDEDIIKAEDESLEFLPVGPILALPYIGNSTIMSCIIYSGHILEEALHKHSYFLIVMGLILSKTEGGWANGEKVFHSKFLSKNTKKEYLLDDCIQDMSKSGPSTTIKSLDESLSDYRDKLSSSIMNNRTTLVNYEDIMLKINLLQDNIEELQDKLDHDEKYEDEFQSLVNEAWKNVSLILVGEKWSDNIFLSSIFSDRIREHGSWKTAAVISEIKEWMDDRFLDESLIAKALRIIKIQDEEEENTFNCRPKAFDLIKETFSNQHKSNDLHKILRLCILFANVWAIENTRGGHGFVTTVYQRLGDGIEQNTYLNWFGVRNKNNPRNNKYKVEFLSTANNVKDRCFLNPSENNKIEIKKEDYEALKKYRTLVIQSLHFLNLYSRDVSITTHL